MTIKFQQSDCIDIEKALGREWLETNGIGGYASSSISGCNTRRYHGLLVARLERPAGKFVLLSRYEESLYDHPTEQSISTAQYPGKVQPDGYRHMASYSFDKTPVFTFRTPHVNLTRRVAMISGRNAVFTKYECTKNPRAARLVIRPLLAYRDFHALTCQNVTLQVRTFPARQGFKIQPYEGMPPLFIQTTGRFEFFPSPVWYRHVEYAREMERGFPFQEDLFSPGMFEIDFPKGAELLVSASTTELSDLDPIWEREMNERSLFFKGLRGTAMQKTLRWSAQQFLSTKLSGNRAITAGFPWFLEWGRDAMIALPGLLLDGEKNPDYLDVLKEFSANMKDGVVPNFLGLRPDDNAYNSADASLWFAWAVQQYLAATGDYAALKGDILNALDNIFDGYSRGTLNDIRMLDNGLIRAGSYHTQLTWMDANSNGMPVTPRNGCPVEINALWYNFLRFLAELGPRGDVRNGQKAAALAQKVQQSFIEAFWQEDGQYLADVWNDGEVDRAIRPNQVFAVSLPFSPLSDDRARAIMDCVRRELYTPLGLRTLSPADSRFCPAYEGGPAERDGAYHNGTVWPWLIGHYAQGRIRTAPGKEVLPELEEIVEAFRAHLSNEGVGTVSEIFDGLAPSAGKGCTSQAWSVAEVLRVTQMVEQLKRGA